MIWKRVAVTGISALTCVVLLAIARNFFGVSNSWIWGGVYFAATAVTTKVTFHAIHSTVISQALGALIFAIGATISINWGLGVFIVSQNMMAYANHAESLSALHASRFERTYASQMGNMFLVGSA